MSTAAPAIRMRFAIAVAAIAIVLAVAIGALGYLAQPQRATRLILDRVGAALGLQIQASTGRLELSGVPTLVVTGVNAREAGTVRAMFRADRISLSVPWSTIRSRGATLTVDHVALDRPALDVAALQHWLAKRPPGNTRIPVLTDGLELRNGRVRGTGWSIDAVDMTIPSVNPARPVTAQVSGRVSSGSLRLPFALSAMMSSPSPDASIGLAGQLSIGESDWRIPAHVVLSGLLRSHGGIHLQRTKLAASARYESGTTRAPFALGVAGTFRFAPTPRLAPAAISLRASGLVPTLDASGEIAIGDTMVVALAGRLARWPSAWPALPPPLQQSTSTLPFRLRYAGNTGLADPVSLRLQLDDATFDARVHVADVSSWMSASSGGSPLPPLDGTFAAPRIDIAGAQLEGVEVTLDDPRIDNAPLRP